MSCGRPEHEVAAYLDGELDLASALAFERHLAECADCARALATERALHEAIGQAGLRFEAPPDWTRRLRGAARSAARPAVPPRPAWRLSAFPAMSAMSALATLLLVAVVSFSLGRFGPRPGPDLAQEVVTSHVRSLLAGRPADVISTDQHTVKPWFAGKLDYAPLVVDLSGQGFPLKGGRLDYLGRHPVAALVYGADRHTINVFTWPMAYTPDRSGPDPTAFTRQGFHLVHWSQSGMTYWAVSDASEERLRQLARRLEAAATETGR